MVAADDVNLLPVWTIAGIWIVIEPLPVWITNGDDELVWMVAELLPVWIIAGIWVVFFYDVELLRVRIVVFCNVEPLPVRIVNFLRDWIIIAANDFEIIPLQLHGPVIDAVLRHQPVWTAAIGGAKHLLALPRAANSRFVLRLPQSHGPRPGNSHVRVQPHFPPPLLLRKRLPRLRRAVARRGNGGAALAAQLPFHTLVSLAY